MRENEESRQGRVKVQNLISNADTIDGNRLFVISAYMIYAYIYEQK